MPTDSGTEIRIVTSPEMDKRVVLRGPDPKMVEILGTMQSRQAAEDAIEDLADRVMRQANIMLSQAERRACMKLESPPECATETAPLQAILTSRKRSTTDPANLLAILVNDSAMLPDGVAAALVEVLAQVVPEPIEVPVIVEPARVGLPSAEDRVALAE